MLPVQFHSLLDAAYPWPFEVLKIYALLSQPLSLPNGWFDQPFPEALRSILDELDSRDLPTQHSEPDTQKPHLGDVLGLALYTVATVSSGGPSRSAVNIFIRGLAYACSKNAALLTDVAFARPRTDVENRGCDGQAFVLACHIIGNAQQVQDSNQAMDVDEEAECENEEDGEVDDDGEGEEEEEEEGETSGPSETFYPVKEDSDSRSGSEGYTRNAFGSKIALSPPPPSIDVSTDGHILPGCGKHTCAALPFLCVANQENIDDLMSSAAYQRYVWGITEPVLGFLLSPTRYVATLFTLFLSWVDPDTKILHIASANPAENAVCSFHFSDLHSTLRFAQFVLNLSTRFANVAQRGSPLSENNKLDWRADNPKTQDPGTFRNRVEQWVRGVYLASNVDVPHLQHPNDLSRMDFNEQSPEDMSQESSTKKPKQTESFLKPESAGDPSRASTATSTPSLKYKSSSEYAALSADGLPDKGRSDVLNWMLDRTVRRAGYHKHIAPDRPMDGAWIKGAVSEINKHHAEMQELFAFRNPEQWENERPIVDTAVESFLSQLLVQVAHKYEKSDPKPPALKAEDATLIGTRLSPALFACIGASLHTLLLQQGFKVNEAESRIMCDIIVHLFYGENFALNVMLERSIHLCMNPTTASIDAGGFSSADFEARLKENTDLHDNEVSSAWWGRLDTITKLQATNAWHQAEYLQRTWEAMGEGGIKNHLQGHDQQEPRTGVADAILCVAVDMHESSFTPVDVRDLSFFTESTHKPVAVAPWQPVPNNLEELSVPLPLASGQAPRWDVIKRYLENPFVAKREPVAPPVIDNVPNMSEEEVSIFPHVLVEYKKEKQDEGAALNQGRMYLVSVITYYATVLGIQNRRFYCLVTSGKNVAVIAGWKSAGKQDIFIFDRNVITFDLSSPIDVYHFATILLRLREDQEDLKKVIGEKLQNLDKRQLNDFKKWRKSVQTPSQKTAEITQSSSEKKLKSSAGGKKGKKKEQMSTEGQ
ncbi:hypothetical protein FB45DRAFT_811455 [Roridomyces roridus]|uniref:Uncharacterized protein n=1 Tax=Roridomyces roridus TaxID=1738132 RepID=A0AAD7AYD6_9AGAR|nr:hypothetical protein FB45DRAFT_811455 [Roridomyces roridus]